MNRVRQIVALGIAAALCGCTLPQDPSGTFERVKNGNLRAGITENPPWTRLENGKPAGIEVELLERFASKLNAKIDWQLGSESHLLESLHEERLDVVIGGLKQDTPWNKKVGLTRPYYQTADEKYVLAVASGENRWLLELETFLQSQKSEIQKRFLEGAPP